MAHDVHPPVDTLNERVRLRAYFLHELRLREGHPGDALDDWLRAESELLAIGKPPGADANDGGGDAAGAAAHTEVKPATRSRSASLTGNAARAGTK
jgi:hypothetical protein